MGIFCFGKEMYPKLPIYKKGFKGIVVFILAVINLYPCVFGWSSETHSCTEAGAKKLG